MSEAGGQSNLLRVAVTLRARRAEAVEIVSPRVDASRIFVGRTPDEAALLASRLFSLCPAAQSIAAQAAGEAAAGLAPSDDARRERVSRLLCERLGEMLRAGVMFWPGEAPRDGVPALREALAGLRGGPGENIEQVLRATEALGLESFASGGAGVFARQWEQLLADDWARGPHRGAPDPLTPEDDEAVAQAMPANGFCRAPRLPGRRAETGAFARMAPGGYANSLTGRLAARFNDMASTLAAIRALQQRGALPEQAFFAQNLGPGLGFAAVESARGRLYHRVALDGDGRIAAYDIVAPTEWNFHPDGPFARFLRGAEIGAGASARLLAERAAFLFDPCIGVAAEILPAAEA